MSQPHDSQWYAQFEPLGNFESWEYYASDSDSIDNVKKSFWDNPEANPKLDYPFLPDKKTINNIRQGLTHLHNEIQNSEPNPLIQKAYQAKIKQKLAEIDMISLSKKISQSRKADLPTKKKFLRLNYQVFTQPPSRYFWYTCARLQKKVVKYLDHKNKMLAKSAKELWAIIPHLSDNQLTKYHIPLPPKEHMESIKKLAYRNLEEVLHHDIHTPPTRPAPPIQAYFTTLLNKLNLTASGWTAEVNHHTSISVSTENKCINIPQNYTQSRQRIRELTVHEFGTHVIRYINGLNSTLHLLAEGLAHYEIGEEGVATLRQQLLYPNIYRYNGFRGTWAIGLALGYDGKSRSFKDIYKILEKYFVFKNLRQKTPPPEAIIQAREQAWRGTLRVFRGTPGDIPGFCYIKDHIYRTGNIRVWQAVLKDRQVLENINLGKFDPTNQQHQLIVKSLVNT